MAQTDILLESGTNEVEIAEFTLAGQRFGVNVAKVREFIPFKSLTVSHPPQMHPSVGGVFFLRGHNIPLVNLDVHLALPRPAEGEWQVVVVTEFNNMTTAFITDEINMIHRVSWDQFKPLNLFFTVESPYVTGSINLDGNEVLVLDLEHVIGEIFPESVINYDESSDQEAGARNRSEIKIIFAEDSSIIRRKVSDILKSVGYGQVSVFTNGQDALEAVVKLRDQAEQEGKSISQFLNLVLTDIEMPKMDGLTLCRNIKKEMRLDVPVVMFSSLINEQMANKCRSVGSDGFTAKPETQKLLSLIDELTLEP